MTNPRVKPDDAHMLYTAAVAGVPELALQLERLGISDPVESLWRTYGICAAACLRR